LFAAFVTVSIIAAGCLVSLYAEEIKHAWPISWHAKDRMPRSVFWSWVVGIVASVTFFVRQVLDQRERDAAQARLVNQAKELEWLVRTMPPAKFLDSFADLYRHVDGSAEGALGQPEPPFEVDVVEAGIRFALSAIATLARIFDGDITDERYAGNVMLFRKSELLTDDELNEIANRLKFCEPGVSAKNLLGVLDLEPALSATTMDKQAPDPTITPFALPVPLIPKAHGRYKVLPGAPLAFIENRPDIHDSFSRLRKWCDDFGDFSQSVKEELSGYLAAQNAHMRSFVSIPLALPNQAPFAVLNLHSVRTGMLRNHPDAAEQFVMIVKPMQMILVKLLIAHGTCQRRIPSGAATIKSGTV